MTTREILQLVATLVGGGAMGALITLAITSWRNRVQPLTHVVEVVPVFRSAPGRSFNAQLTGTRRTVPGVLVWMLLLVACDPAYWLNPVTVPGQDRFVRAVAGEDVAIQVREIGGLTGSRLASPEVAIINLSDRTVLLESAEIVVGSNTIAARLPGRGEPKWRTAGPGEVRRLSVLFEFDRPAALVIGSGCILRLYLKIGDTKSILSIDYAA